MSHCRRVFAVLVSLCALLLVVPTVSAKSATLYVGCSGSSPNYATLQAAVDAANSGDTVSICGTATGPVSLHKSLTLTGASGATIQAPAVNFQVPLANLPPQFTSDHLFAPQALVVVWGANVNATISNLTIAGLMPGNGGCAEQEFGVLVIGGASADLSNDRVLNIRDTNSGLLGCQFGVAVQVGREYWPLADFSNFVVENFVGHASISGTTVSGYQKNGVTVDGPGSAADIQGNTVTGAGRVNYIAQNGIQVSRGASGDIRDTTVSGNAYTGNGGAASTGIVLFGGCGDPLVIGVQVMKNTLVNDDIGIQFDNETDACDGTPTATMTNNKAVNNTLSNDAFTNQIPYQAGIADIGNNDKIINNTITGAGYALTVDATSSAKVHANKGS